MRISHAILISCSAALTQGLGGKEHDACVCTMGSQKIPNEDQSYPQQDLSIQASDTLRPDTVRLTNLAHLHLLYQFPGAVTELGCPRRTKEGL